MWTNRDSHSQLVGMQNDRATLEDILEVFYKAKHVLLYNPATVLLCINIYPPDLKTCIKTKPAYECL